jgi:hypothetical protein
MLFGMIERRRRVFVVLLVALLPLIGYVYELQQSKNTIEQSVSVPIEQSVASKELDKLEIKGRAPKTGYSRSQFGNGWADYNGCDLRNIILKRDLSETVIDQTNNCHVLSGLLNDPYTGKQIVFLRGSDTSQEIHIDHVVALSDAWQKGAQQLDESTRLKFANDPLNLLAVDGPANQKKGDGDAATWLPPNKEYRCRYIARQIAVKIKYFLWVTKAEYDAMKRTLSRCPSQVLPIEENSEN